MTQIDEQPLITFALFAYNQERFIEEAVKGALAQTYSPLEIILSDDCSTDRTFEIMERMAKEYQGPHTVVLNRNEKNLGLCPHINRVFGMASAEIVVVAAGDDISFPNRVENTWPVFSNNPDVTSMCMGFIPIMADGARKDANFPGSPERKQNMEDFLRGEGIFIGATSAYRKTLVTDFEPLSYQTKAEDYPLFFRSMLIGGSHYHLPTHGIYYMRHEKAISNQIDFDIWVRVYLQNLIDLEYVVNQGLITSSDKIKKIKSEMRNRLEGSLIRINYRESKFKLLFMIFKVMPAGCYTREKKVKMLKSKIIRHLTPWRKNVHHHFDLNGRVEPPAP